MLIFFFLSWSYHMFFLKNTVSSIVIAYLARFNPQFNEFRAFKVPFPSCSSSWSQVVDFCSFLFSGCGHRRICIRNIRKHHDNQHFGVVFVSSLQQTTGSKILY